MKKIRSKLIDKCPVNETGTIWSMKFHAPDIEAEPGQFVNIEVSNHYLRRPISVSEYSEDILTLLIQRAGRGSEAIISTSIGERLDMLAGLGNKFSLPDVSVNKKDSNMLHVYLIAGGIGYAPLVGLMKKFKIIEDCKVKFFLGFNKLKEVPLDHISSLIREGWDIKFICQEGNGKIRGNVIDLLETEMSEDDTLPDYFYTCGPVPMMKRICGFLPSVEGQISMETIMGCGFGACMGCSILTSEGPKRICKEGPVFKRSQLLWK